MAAHYGRTRRPGGGVKYGVYQVTGTREYRGHTPGAVFEAILDPAAAAASYRPWRHPLLRHVTPRSGPRQLPATAGLAASQKQNHPLRRLRAPLSLQGRKQVTYTKKIAKSRQDHDRRNRRVELVQRVRQAINRHTGRRLGVLRNRRRRVPARARNQQFTGTAWYTEELGAIVEPLYKNRTPCVITWQPNGLVDATREIYSGTWTITEFSPMRTRERITVGNWMTFPFDVYVAPDSNGITVGELDLDMKEVRPGFTRGR
jgi:hypothetical protein